MLQIVVLEASERTKQAYYKSAPPRLATGLL